MILTFPEDRSIFRIEDAYKLIHQAFLGPGHAIVSERKAEEFLRDEWEKLGDARPGERLIETPVPDAPFVRLHLRPYRDAGGEVSVLLSHFLRSVATPTDLNRFLETWKSLGMAIRSGEESFEVAEFERLDQMARNGGFPAIHHSKAYKGQWKPAYRVLARDGAEKLRESLSR